MRKYNINSGWHKESERHSLASRGIKTGRMIDFTKHKELIVGGVADYMPDDKFDGASLLHGISVEMEHTNNRAIAKEIAKDHLAEHSQYYKYLKEMEHALSAVPDYEKLSNGVKRWKGR